MKCPVPFRSIFSKEPSTEAHGTVVNLSIRGCSIDSNVPFPKGARLCLKFLIADGEPAVEVEEAMIRAVRGTRMGIRFMTLQNEEEDRLCQLIRTRLSSRLR